MQLHVCLSGMPQVQIRVSGKIYELALQDLPGKTSPYFKDHRQSKNLYISRYGEIWVDKLNSYTAMSKFCCITDII